MDQLAEGGSFFYYDKVSNTTSKQLFLKLTRGGSFGVTREGVEKSDGLTRGSAVSQPYKKRKLYKIDKGTYQAHP